MALHLVAGQGAGPDDHPGVTADAELGQQVQIHGHHPVAHLKEESHGSAPLNGVEDCPRTRDRSWAPMRRFLQAHPDELTQARRYTGSYQGRWHKGKAPLEDFALVPTAHHEWVCACGHL